MDVVDWDLAAATAVQLAPTGPDVTWEEAHAAVAELRELAGETEQHVREFTGLTSGVAPEAVAVVDRPGWIRANVAGFRAVLEPFTDKLLAKRAAAPGGTLVTSVGSRVTGVQAGVILAYLSKRVLGQYEIFLPPGSGQGRLTLVAPNIVAVERALGVDPHDFRTWVCLHEVTHRTQFTAVPWLREHVQNEIQAFLLAADLDPGAMAARLRDAVAAVADSVRGRPGPSLLEVVQTPEQRAILARITGMMSLLEGHSDYVMDGVGPTVVPSVGVIRERFDARRRGSSGADRILRRLLGIELKMLQYAEGARFVRTVVDAVGMDGFNRVWTSPETLPDHDEIRTPQRWLDRVSGLPPAVTA